MSRWWNARTIFPPTWQYVLGANMAYKEYFLVQFDGSEWINSNGEITDQIQVWRDLAVIPEEMKHDYLEDN